MGQRQADQCERDGEILMMHRTFMHVLCVLAAAVAMFTCVPAFAADSLEKWRSEISVTRSLAENDAGAAYKEAQRLQAAIPDNAVAEDKTRLFNLLARIELYRGLIEQAVQHSALAKKIAKESHDNAAQVEADLVIAASAINQGRLEDMIAVVQESMVLLSGVKSEALRAETMFYAAMMYLRFGHFDDAITIAMQSLDIAKSSNDPIALAYAEQGMATTYSQSSLHNQADEHYQRMLLAARQGYSALLEAAALLGMSESNSPDADRWRDEAIELFRRADAPLYVSHALFLKADRYFRNKQPGKALSLLDEDVAIYQQYANPIGLWWTLNKRSHVLQTMGRLQAAHSDAERAQKLADTIGFTVYLAGSARRLSDLFAAEGDFQQAYRWSAQAAELNVKLEQENSGKHILELAQRYRQESKQRQIDELTRHNEQQNARQRWLWTVLIGSAALLALTWFFMIRLGRSRDEVRALNIDLEQRVKARTDELRQQTRYLRTLFDTLPVSVWLKDTAGRYLTINTSHLSLNGVTAEQMIGKTDEEIWPGEIGAAFRAVDIDVMASRQRKMQEVAIPGHNGEIFWREIDKAPVVDEDGTLLGTVGVGRDISERKHYEQSLLAQAKLEQRLSAVAANIPGFIYTFRFDDNGNISFPFVSAGVKDLFGLEPDDIREDANILRSRFHLDDMPRIQERVQESMQTLAPFNIEIRVSNRDNAERWIAMHSIPIRQDDGSTEWNGIMLDVTERHSMVEMLAARDQELRALAESSPGMMGSFYLRPDGKVCMPYVSPNIQELFGLSPEEVAEDASSLLALNHPDDAQMVQDSIAESARTMTHWRVEFRILHPVKGERWMEGNTNPVAHPDGGVIWYGHVHDITWRKRIEDALRLSQENLAEAQRIAQVGSWEMNLVDNVLSWSDEVYRIFEIDPQQFGASYQAFISAVHPDDRDSLDSAYKASLENHERFEIEHRLLLPDGRIKHVFERCESYFDDNGKALRSLGTVQDITERKRLEDELQQREQMFRALAENAPDNIVRYDTEGRIAYVNPVLEKALGKQAAALIGTRVRDNHPDGNFDEYAQMLDDILAGGREGEVELALPGEAGETRIHQVRMVAEHNEADELTGVLSIGRDITDLKRFEAARETAFAEALRLAKTRSEFLAQMSHELRTPLNGILGYAQIFGRDKKLDERQLAGVNVIRQCGEHLLTLINDILDFAKIDAGKIEINPGNIQPDKFLRTIAGIIRIKADAKRLEFSCKLSDDIPEWIRVDEKRLRQVLLNLLSNAVKFTERGGVTLCVNVTYSGRLRFEVQDTGIGINADQLETIFQPFEQLGDQQHRYSGTGLGLPISRQLVQLMGGDIYVSSRPGQGSTFWFELDVGVRISGETAKLPRCIVSGYAGLRKKILVVDDVDENRAVVVQMLEPLGFETIEVENGSAALIMAEDIVPDLILMDSVMSEMDGLEATRLLRKSSALRSIPIIAFSASASREDEADCLLAGANSFLPKPLDMVRLLEQMGALLEIEWKYESDDTVLSADNACVVPPAQEMDVLHHLALSGNMRDILLHCDRIVEMNALYDPFAEQLRKMAMGYQTRAILSFIEQYLERKADT